MIPCWPQPALQFGPHTLYAHGTLLVLGALLAAAVFVLRARASSLSGATAFRFILVLAPVGLLGSHLMYAALDAPSSLFELQGISSLGGILAGILALALCVFWGRDCWRWFDVASYAGLCGAPFARLGCFLAHDRLGIHASSPFSLNCFDGPRLDLALLEILFLAVCLGVVTWLERRAWHPTPGTLCALLAVSYGLFRFFLGQLAESPRRSLGLAPEQLGAVALVIAGVCSWLLARRARKHLSAPGLAKPSS